MRVAAHKRDDSISENTDATGTLITALRIAIYGGADCSAEVYEQAREIGRLLARRGVIIYCGGLNGVMEAVSRGVSEESGTVVGILPEADAGSGNEFLTIPVATGAGSARNVMIANSVQGAIAIDGSYGTLSEIGHTLRMGKPVVGLGTWDIEGVVDVADPEAAVNRIMELI